MSKRPDLMTDLKHEVVERERPAEAEVMRRLYEAYRRHRQKFVRAEDLEAELDEAIAMSGTKADTEL